MNQDIHPFLSYLKSTRHLAANSLDGYRRDLEDLARELQAHHDIVRTADIKPFHLSSYMNRLKEQGERTPRFRAESFPSKPFFSLRSRPA